MRESVCIFFLATITDTFNTFCPRMGHLVTACARLILEVLLHKRMVDVIIIKDRGVNFNASCLLFYKSITWTK